MEDKVISLVDMDCFYVQVEQKLNPELRGRPCAIVQYNKWRGGSIIAVDYEARKYGVTRSLKGDEAKRKCPNICLASVPEKRGKADLTNYRKASEQVMKVLSQFTSVIERASIDEAYLDLTEPARAYIRNMTQNGMEYSSLSSTHVAGYNEVSTQLDSVDVDVDGDGDGDDDDVIDFVSTEQDTLLLEEDVTCDELSNELKVTCSDHVVSHTSDKQLHSSTMEWLKVSGNASENMLLVGAILTQQIRDTVLTQVGYTCSAGISYNKMLAKLAAGMNKPNQQTILPRTQLARVFSCTPFNKVRHLGGKLGKQIQETLGINYVGQLQQYSIKYLQDSFGAKTGLWLFDACRGKCNEEIHNRTITKSIGCGKNFPGPSKLTTSKKIQYWLEQLSGELIERLEEDRVENMRRAQSVSVHFLLEGSSSSLARSFPLSLYDTEYVVSSSWDAINRGQKPVTNEYTPLTWTTGILNIHLSASKFVPCSKGKTKSLLSLMPTYQSNSSNSQSVQNSIESSLATSNTSGFTYYTAEENQSTFNEHQMDITNFFTPMKRKQLQSVIESPFTKKRIVSAVTEELPEDNQFECTICSVCGEEIFRLVLEEHMDYHMAMALQT